MLNWRPFLWSSRAIGLGLIEGPPQARPGKRRARKGDGMNVIERMAEGIDLFGDYATWLWMAPAIWGGTAILLWFYMGWLERRRDRAYLAYVSRNLPLLQRIAKQRAIEVVHDRRMQRMTRQWKY
jgi:hypothetical protein